MVGNRLEIGWVIGSLGDRSFGIQLSCFLFPGSQGLQMIKLPRFLTGSTFLLLALLAPGCSSDSAGPDETDEAVYLRITNALATSKVVHTIGSDQIPVADRITTSFGDVAPGATTGFQEVNTTFFVYINNDILSNGSSDRFGIDDQPTNQWTLTLQENGGWSLMAYFGS